MRDEDALRVLLPPPSRGARLMRWVEDARPWVVVGLVLFISLTTFAFSFINVWLGWVVWAFEFGFLLAIRPSRERGAQVLGESLDRNLGPAWLSDARKAAGERRVEERREPAPYN